MKNEQKNNLRNNLMRFAFFLPLLAAVLLTVNPPQVLAVGDHLDVTFNGNGKLSTDFDGAEDYGNDVAIQADGKIVVVGTGLSNVSSFALARYNSNGSLDITFSGDGKATSFPGGSFLRAFAVAIQPDGKIIVAGSYYNAGNSLYSFALARFTTNGTLDTTFDSDGIVITSSPEFFGTEIYALAIQTDGKIVAVGGVDRDWFLTRYNTNGGLDIGFSGDGIVSTDFGGNVGERANGVAILSNGKILVGGTGNPGGQDFALALYTTNGSLDTNWGGGDGKIVTDFNNGDDVVQDMKLQPDGKIVLAGSRVSGGSTDFALARYNADGTLDTSFDTDGKATLNINPAGNDSANEIALQTDGKIVVVGQNGTDFALARFNPNGSLDVNFGQAGILLTDMFNGSEDIANAIAVQADGKLVVAGTQLNTANGSTRNFSVARYLPNFPVSAGSTPFDFDGDRKTDLGIFRPAPGEWWINRSSNGSTFAAQFGTSSDRIVPADFTGDGKADIAVFRRSNGNWFVLRSEDFSFYAFPFGANGDLPVPADYDGDSKADAAVFRPTNLTWYISKSSGGTDIIGFGAANDRPVVADYDGDGKADIAINRPNGANGAEWWIRRSSNATVFALQFGQSTDKFVPGDFTGDGKADIAFWRPNGNWFVLRSEDFSFFSFPFGTPGDIPVAGDYDGDGKFDAAVFRPSNSTWYAQRSTAGTLIQQFGIAGDQPLPNAFVP